MSRLPASLELYELLKKLPGYTARTLMNEDGALVEDWLTYMRIERAVVPRGG